MNTTIYLIRHAQSHQIGSLHHHEWPLSETGQRQAKDLAPLLVDFGIEKVYSSPLLRCRETIRPFLEQTKLVVAIHDDLRERLVAPGITDRETWVKSWDDFGFKLPDCECSNSAQKRFVNAMYSIADGHHGQTSAVSSHGNIIALFLNHIDSGFMRLEAEKIRNPEVIRVRYHEKKFLWDREFSLPKLDEIATHHNSTPVTR